MKTKNYKPYRGVEICRNYGGWIVVNGYDYNIFGSYESAKNAVRKHLDGTQKREPIIIGEMTEQQFINAFKF